jgi:hypothetical protein
LQLCTVEAPNATSRTLTLVSRVSSRAKLLACVVFEYSAGLCTQEARPNHCMSEAVQHGDDMPIGGPDLLRADENSIIIGSDEVEGVQDQSIASRLSFGFGGGTFFLFCSIDDWQ